MLSYEWMKMHGYSEYNPIEIDDKYREIIKFLKKNIEAETYKNKDSLIKNLFISRNFMKKTFKLHKVKCMDGEALVKKFDGKYVDGYYTACAMENNIKEVNPLNIKKNLIDLSAFDSCVEENIILCDDPRFLSIAPIVFDHICLSSRIPDVTGCLYAHELMHTQVDSNKGIVEDYLNSEVLSIFVELLNAQNKDQTGELSRYIINKRLNVLYMSLNNIDNMENNNNVFVNSDSLLNESKYVVSTLKALNMFDLYMSLNDKKKKYVLKSIQKVIDGSSFLEDELDFLDITLDNSQDIELLKRFI